MKNKERLYITIIIVLFCLVIWQFIPIYIFIEVPDDKVCVKWSKPISSDNGMGKWRYCLNAVDYIEDFNEACYFNYNCSIYGSWRASYLGIPPSCLFMNINYSYWGNSSTSRFSIP